jgi:hypothetical protein
MERLPLILAFSRQGRRDSLTLGRPHLLSVTYLLSLDGRGLR